MPSVEQPDVLSVSQLTRRVKGLLEAEISYVWVAGEISNWRVSPAGHAYFTLKDKDSQVDAVMFRGRLMKLRFGPESGLDVVVHGLVTVYEKRGNYQIVCEEMHPKGLGALQLAFEKLKRKLDEEGLFDEAHKKPLPLLPRRIGIVTSPTGAAIRDMLHVIGRRFANVHILLFPARVQGEEAAEEIVEGIRVLDAHGVDVLIIGRGGGSLEDLWPFNEEIVVRAVHQVKTPTISAVGHEIDFALTDFAADVRAPTPSAAAEIVVQEQEALVNRVKSLRSALSQAAGRHVERARSRLSLARSSHALRQPEELLRRRRQDVDGLRMRLDGSVSQLMERSRARWLHAARSLVLLSPSGRVRRTRERLADVRRRLSQAGASALGSFRARLQPIVAQLDALSPLAVLARGYALAWKQPENTLVRDAAQLAVEDELRLRFGSGWATAIVRTIEDEADGGTWF